MTLKKKKKTVCLEFCMERGLSCGRAFIEAKFQIVFNFNGSA